MRRYVYEYRADEDGSGGSAMSGNIAIWLGFVFLAAGLAFMLGRISVANPGMISAKLRELRDAIGRLFRRGQ